MGREDQLYAPPREDAADAPRASIAIDEEGRFIMAGRGSRFFGALIDGVFARVSTYAIAAVLMAIDRGRMPSLDAILRGMWWPGGIFDWIATLSPLLVQAVLIARRGQSIGKVVVRARIVVADGKTAGLYRGFVLRTLPMTFLLLLPDTSLRLGVMSRGTAESLTMLVAVLWLVDVLWILGAPVRCLHDRIAGTYVAKLPSPWLEEAMRDMPDLEIPRKPSEPAAKKKKKRRAVKKAPVAPPPAEPGPTSEGESG